MTFTSRSESSDQEFLLKEAGKKELAVKARFPVYEWKTFFSPF